MLRDQLATHCAKLPHPLTEQRLLPEYSLFPPSISFWIARWTSTPASIASKMNPLTSGLDATDFCAGGQAQSFLVELEQHLLSELRASLVRELVAYLHLLKLGLRDGNS